MRLCGTDPRASHEDITVELVGPDQGTGKQAIILMSHAGGNNPIADVNVTFDEDTLGPIPDNSAIRTGSYQTAAYGTVPVLPSPAPVPHATTLRDFNGTNPNGTWKLFIYDDMTGPAGQPPGAITGSWCLTITTD